MFVNGSPYSIGLLSCLSVTLVYCSQTVERIKMKLGMQVGLGHIVLDGDPVSLSFWLMSIVPKWLDGSRCHFVWRRP